MQVIVFTEPTETDWRFCFLQNLLFKEQRLRKVQPTQTLQSEMMTSTLPSLALCSTLLSNLKSVIYWTFFSTTLRCLTLLEYVYCYFIGLSDILCEERRLCRIWCSSSALTFMCWSAYLYREFAARYYQHSANLLTLLLKLFFRTFRRRNCQILLIWILSEITCQLNSTTSKDFLLSWSFCGYLFFLTL